jgi:hypothetical protein
VGRNERGLESAFRGLLRFDQGNCAIAPAAFGLERATGLGQLALGDMELGFHVIDLRESLIQRAGRSGLGSNALELVFKLHLLLLGVAEAALERFGTVALIPLKLLHGGARLDQLLAHSTEFMALGFDLTHGMAGGGGFGFRARTSVLELGAHLVDVLLVGRELIHGGLGLATI